MDTTQFDPNPEWADETLSHFEKATGVRLSLFVDISKLDKQILATSLIESLDTITRIVGTLEEANQASIADEVIEDFRSSITAPPIGSFFVASQNHFIRSIKQDTKHMPRPLRKFLNEHGSTMSVEQATGMHRYLRGEEEGTNEFLEFLSNSAEGEVIRAKLTLRRASDAGGPDPRALARKYWMSLQLWRMTPQARRACMGLSEKSEQDLRRKEHLPVAEEPPIIEYNPARRRFIDRQGKETMRSLPRLIRAIRLSTK